MRAPISHSGCCTAARRSRSPKHSAAPPQCVLDADKEMAVGLDINANHVRAVTKGVVTGTARPLHIGRSTQVWEIRIEDEHSA